MAKVVRFDAAGYLKDAETIAEYLSAALKDASADVFATGAREVFRGRGMARLTKGFTLSLPAVTTCLSYRPTWILDFAWPCERMTPRNRERQ